MQCSFQSNYYHSDFKVFSILTAVIFILYCTTHTDLVHHKVKLVFDTLGIPEVNVVVDGS